MNDCQCGCGAKVANMFKAGHDTRHKSRLIREVMAGDAPEAKAEIERRGWGKFLAKAKMAHYKKTQPPSVRRALTEAEQQARARQRIELINNMKEAWAVLEEVDRSPEVQVTRHNWEAILDDPLGFGL